MQTPIASVRLLSRLTNQSELVAQTLTDSMVSVVRELLTVLAIFAYLFYLNAILTSLALLAGSRSPADRKQTSEHYVAECRLLAQPESDPSGMWPS